MCALDLFVDVQVKRFCLHEREVKGSRFKVESLKSKTIPDFLSAGRRVLRGGDYFRAGAAAFCSCRKSGSKLPHSKLELAGFLARPALDDDLGLGEKFHGVAPLAMENAEETFFPAAEGKIGHRRGYPDIDADISCGRFVTELARGGSARGKERSLVSVGAATKKFHGFINRVGVNQAEYGAEDFRIGKLAGGGQSVQNRGRQKIS